MFHEDPAGMFADLKRGADFERYAVNTPARNHAAAPRRQGAGVPVARREARGPPDVIFRGYRPRRPAAVLRRYLEGYGQQVCRAVSIPREPAGRGLR